MEKYDYRKAVAEKIGEWFDTHNIDWSLSAEEIYSQTAVDIEQSDAVTGWFSGGFYDGQEWVDAKECLRGNGDLVAQAILDGIITVDNELTFDAIDVAVRCYVVSKILKKLICLKKFHDLARVKRQYGNEYPREMEQIYDDWNRLVPIAEDLGISHKQMNAIWHGEE